jgi:hypothetical protein
MNKQSVIYIFLFTLVAGFSSCQLKEVVNPNITDESYTGTTQSAQIWLNGMNRQLALALNDAVVNAEITSDNYYNNSSLSNKVFDIPTILYSDLDVDNMQRSLGRLREMGEYGLSKIIPADKGSTPAIKADMLFLSGYACLLGGEMYVGLPLTAGGPVVTPKEYLQKAVDYFKEAITVQTDASKRNNYTLALARAYYDLGDKANAKIQADLIMRTVPTLLVNAKFDGANGVSNTMQTYTFSSSTNTFAPLPRLDFLDPKYFHVGNIATGQKTIALLKGEEAYLILAEIAIGEGNLASARTIMKSLIQDVVSKRPTASVSATTQQRKGNRSDYPLVATVSVKADAQAPARTGLVLDRQAANITVYTVSGTSVKAADIDNAVTADDVLYLLCLMRQEIFMSEGRRMTDLGIRFPVSQVEMQNNPNVKTEHTLALIPNYIPKQLGMDDFTYDKANALVTIKNDMNKILVQNKNSAGVLPMLK